MGEGQSLVDGHVCRKGGGLGPFREKLILLNVTGTSKEGGS